MTIYQYYESQRERFQQLADTTTDAHLKVFYTNTAAGFAAKRDGLQVRDAGEKSTIRKITESEVVAEIKKVISMTGIKLQRINTGAFTIGKGKDRRFIRSAEAGTLDFEGYDKHGRFIGIEAKRPAGGRISDAQAARINDINSKGGLAFVVTSGADAIELLREHDCI